MPTVNLKKTAHPAGMTPCSGRHVALAITGAWNAVKVIHIDNIKGRPLNEDERDQFLELWLRVHCAGKTLAELNAEFTAGVDVVI